MAVSDSRTGFRLPWSTDRSTSGEAAGDSPAVEPVATAGDEEPANLGHTDRPDQPDQPVSRAPTAEPTEREQAALPAGPPTGRPSRFLADLARAMQAAAEQARAVALEQYRAEGAAAIERIHGSSASSAAELRRRADEDVATLKEWSKAEIARIREETERRVMARREQLEAQLERHAALVEHEIEQVRGRLASFEQVMGEFFDDLLREDDPARFAARAANLPEPPPFVSPDEGAMEALLAEPGLGLPASALAAEAGASSAAATAGSDAEPALPPDRAPDVAPDVAAVGPHDAPAEPFDPEAAMAAIQAAAEAAESAASAEGAEAIETTENAEGAAESAESPATDAALETIDESAPGPDPRLAALGLSWGFAAAEAAAAQAAAAAATPSAASGTGPWSGEPSPVPTGTIVTQLVTNGLVSVASIASFKRHLGRLAGVAHVGVSSGPDGEFVFAVEHDPLTPLRDLIPTMPGFAARVVGEGEGTLQVSARDPQD
jgi:hypothetical protein